MLAKRQFGGAQDDRQGIKSRSRSIGEMPFRLYSYMQICSDVASPEPSVTSRPVVTPPGRADEMSPLSAHKGSNARSDGG